MRTTQLNRYNEELDTLSQQFTQWRQTRSNKSEKIPDLLLDRALELSQYAPSKKSLLNKLKINHAQLKRQKQTKEARIQPKFAATDFVAMPSPPINTSPTVELVRRDGHKLIISGLNTEQLAQVVIGFTNTAQESVKCYN